MNKIEHIGIAVKDIDKATQIYKSLLGYEDYKTENVESEGVTTSFFRCGESKIELLEATKEDSPISRFIEKRGEGLHHVAFAVDDIRAEIKRLQEEGFVVLNEEPKRGADNKWVVFLHPKSTNGLLVELCQDINDE
jgi:methylmalonyl-CoA/ethylmalonyl-CoA epimerase